MNKWQNTGMIQNCLLHLFSTVQKYWKKKLFLFMVKVLLEYEEPNQMEKFPKWPFTVLKQDDKET